MHLVGFIIRIYHAARSPGRQKRCANIFGGLLEAVRINTAQFFIICIILILIFFFNLCNVPFCEAVAVVLSDIGRKQPNSGDRDLLLRDSTVIFTVSSATRVCCARDSISSCGGNLT